MCICKIYSIDTLSLSQAPATWEGAHPCRIANWPSHSWLQEETQEEWELQNPCSSSVIHSTDFYISLSKMLWS